MSEKNKAVAAAGSLVAIACAALVEKALHCPFCGNKPDVEPWHGGGPDKVSISCDCAAAPSVTHDYPQEALVTWNTRHQEDNDDDV